jgi:transposase
MALSLTPSERLEKLFHRRKCWMLDQLAQALDYALISVRRFLKQIGYFRSYTHNGKWYTLRESPDFDRDGLWHYKGISFSKNGSLTATIHYLVGRSPAGLSANQLNQKLQHPCHAVLTQLHKAGQLDRLHLAGQFRYLARDPQRNRRQREQAASGQGLSPMASLSTQTALWILVEHIKHPGWSFEQIAAYLQAERKLAVAPESIQRFFQEHDLKKTPAAPN